MSEPAYEHDGCAHCIFIGADTPAEGEPKCNQVDVYYCDGFGKTFIRRYSSDPPDYGSWPVGMKPLPERFQRCVDIMENNLRKGSNI